MMRLFRWRDRTGGRVVVETKLTGEVENCRRSTLIERAVLSFTAGASRRVF
jgi:hypothetical protein